MNDQIILELRGALMSGVREDFMRVYQKYTRSFILTDRGEHYYKDLKNKYLKGLKMNDQPLKCLLYLHKLQDTFSNTEILAGNVMIEEVKLDLDNKDELALHEYAYMNYLMQEGYIDSNPSFDEDSLSMFGNLLGGLNFEK